MSSFSPSISASSTRFSAVTAPPRSRRPSEPFAPGRSSSARSCCDSPLSRSGQRAGYEVMKMAEAEPPVLSA